jgi:hypothetical protein
VFLEPQEGFWSCFSWVNLSNQGCFSWVDSFNQVCFSWVDCSNQVQGRAWQGGTPMIPEQEFARRQLGLRKSFTSLKNLAWFQYECVSGGRGFSVCLCGEGGGGGWGMGEYREPAIEAKTGLERDEDGGHPLTESQNVADWQNL